MQVIYSIIQLSNIVFVDFLYNLMIKSLKTENKLSDVMSRCEVLCLFSLISLSITSNFKYLDKWYVGLPLGFLPKASQLLGVGQPPTVIYVPPHYIKLEPLVPVIEFYEC